MNEVTLLLERWQAGDKDAGDHLFREVDGELQRIARRCMSGESTGHTLVPGALVNEAFMKLINQRAGFQNRAHFFGMAAKIMRRILLDHARARSAKKRGDQAVMVTLEEPLIQGANARALDMLTLEAALKHLASLDPMLVQLVEMKLFAGLDMKDIAEVLELTQPTAYRHWKTARVVLYGFMQQAAP